MCLGSLGRVVRVWDEGGMPMAMVDFGEREEPACLAYLPGTPVGANVLVHVGFVLEVLEEDRAADARDLRRRMARG